MLANPLVSKYCERLPLYREISARKEIDCRAFYALQLG